MYGIRIGDGDSREGDFPRCGAGSGVDGLERGSMTDDRMPPAIARAGARRPGGLRRAVRPAGVRPAVGTEKAAL